VKHEPEKSASAAAGREKPRETLVQAATHAHTGAIRSAKRERTGQAGALRKRREQLRPRGREGRRGSCALEGGEAQQVLGARECGVRAQIKRSRETSRETEKQQEQADEHEEGRGAALSLALTECSVALPPPPQGTARARAPFLVSNHDPADRALRPRPGPFACSFSFLHDEARHDSPPRSHWFPPPFEFYTEIIINTAGSWILWGSILHPF
jgi:hypothetical protein